MAEAVVLGSGTSNGVPMIGHDYAESFLANPKNHRTRPSLALIGPTGNLLVDAGPEMRIQMVRENLKRLDAVLITHTHADHVMGMDDLRCLSEISGDPVTVYTLPEHASEIKRIFPYAFREFPPEIIVPRFDLRDVPEVLNVAGLEVRTFLVEHGKTRVISLRVNDFAYVTDVSKIPVESERFLEGLDTLVIDAVRYVPHPNHLTYDQAIEVANRFKPRMTYLTHLSHVYDHDMTEAQLPPHIRLAYDGLRIAL